MNLHGIVAPYIGAVNPLLTVTVQVNIGPTIAADGSQAASYATPGAATGSVGGVFTGTATGTTLTIASVSSGSLWPGDLVGGTDGVSTLAATVLAQLTGPAGGAGTYQISQSLTLGSATITASSTVLNATAVATGALQVGQTIAGGSIAAGTLITAQLSGTAGGVGLYSLNRQQRIVSTALTTSLALEAQVQPVTWRDIQQMEGLTLQGTRWKIYLYGEVDGLVRNENKGGDLITIPASSPHAGVWLVTQVLESWPDWTCAAITLQDGA